MPSVEIHYGYYEHAEVLERSLTPGWEWWFMRRFNVPPFSIVKLVVHKESCFGWYKPICECGASQRRAEKEK